MADAHPDYERLTWEEVDDIASLLHELDEADFDEPSLCDGWLVRDVVGHMAFGHTTPMLPIVFGLVKFRFNISKGSYEMSKEYGRSHTPKELVETWDLEMVERHSRKGIAKTIKWREAFLDHLIHDQDMRRPLGKPREIPDEHLVAAMDLLPRIQTPFFGTKKVMSGLQLRATDVDHRVGDGALVEGKAEALIMAVAGRTVALDELTGEGVPTLRERTGAAAHDRAA